MLDDPARVALTRCLLEQAADSGAAIAVGNSQLRPRWRRRCLHCGLLFAPELHACPNRHAPPLPLRGLLVAAEFVCVLFALAWLLTR